eukprot:TRINITY_DN24057_c0_g1_i1.p1 TRINITY_DN24057_c0_g1~~TRINITY_DN24057_c0_g1_i1.p1  ORF type:complete len:687 (+),score=213.02 TRINITY_DN24057_c0_g1_i1:103-2163(+)
MAWKNAALLSAAVAAATGVFAGYSAGLAQTQVASAGCVPVAAPAAGAAAPAPAVRARQPDPAAAPPDATDAGTCPAIPDEPEPPFGVFPAPPPPRQIAVPAGHYLPCGLKNFTYRYRGKVKLLHHFRKPASGLRCASSTFASLSGGRICVHDARCLKTGTWSPCRPIRGRSEKAPPQPSYPLTHGADIGSADCVVVRCGGPPGCRYPHGGKGRCVHGGRNILTRVVPAPAAAARSQPRRQQLNIVVLLIDSVSWNSYIANFEALQQHIRGLAERRGVHVYNFCHSRSVGHNSAPCQVPMMTGLNHDAIRRDGVYRRDRDLIFAEAQRAGFITAYHFGAVFFEMFPALHLTYSGQRDWKPVAEIDHWNWDFLTEETQTAASNTFQEKRYGCVGDRLTTDFLPPFVDGVFSAYPRRLRKFVWAFDELPHQNDRDMAPRTEPALLRTLSFLDENGHLNDTAVVLLSDHGLGMGHWSETKLGRRERWNPLLTVMLPAWFPDVYPANARALQQNQHRITSSYDVHQTVRHLMSLPSPPPRAKSHGASLLEQLESRSCRSMGLLEKSCPELNETDLPVARMPNPQRAAFEMLANDALLLVNKYVTERAETRDCHSDVRLSRVEEVTRNEMIVLKEDEQVFYDVVFLSEPAARWHIKVLESEYAAKKLEDCALFAGRCAPHCAGGRSECTECR